MSRNIKLEKLNIFIEIYMLQYVKDSVKLKNLKKDKETELLDIVKCESTGYAERVEHVIKWLEKYNELEITLEKITKKYVNIMLDSLDILEEEIFNLEELLNFSKETMFKNHKYLEEVREAIKAGLELELDGEIIRVKKDIGLTYTM